MEYKNFKEATIENKDLCSTIAMEECSELIQAISKAKRDKLDLDNISEEIADVLICIDWIIDIYNIDKSHIELWRNLKEKRIVERLNKNDFK